MSHSPGAIRLPSGKIMHVEYNGTVDQIRPALMDTPEEVSAHWRHPTDIVTCVPCPHIDACGRSQICPHPPVAAEFITCYGGGWSWTVGVCVDCRVVTRHLQPGPDERDGHPAWSPWAADDVR